MNTELIQQYEHTWRIFVRLVAAFDSAAWLHNGRGTITPARLAFHILKGVKYYIEDTSIIVCASGKSFERDWETVQDAELPSQDDILACIDDLRLKTKNWLAGMELSDTNIPFPWAGETKLGLVLFLLRHTIYHLGELSSLLNESSDGETEDHWVKAL